MSNAMLLGVLRMPIPDNPDPLTLRQFVDGARQAAAEIERLTAERDALRAALAELVSCNDICIATVDLTELYYRKERAWEAARALRSGSAG